MNEPRTKKYLQLRDTLCQDMLTGKLKPGDRLPSIRELVRRTSLSQTTVEHALALLQDEGLIRTIPQAGCYVTGLEPRQPACCPHQLHPGGMRQPRRICRSRSGTCRPTPFIRSSST